MSDHDTYAMMDELHAAVQRIEQRRFESWLNENTPYWREGVLALQSALRESYPSMNEMLFIMVEFSKSLPIVTEILDESEG